MAEKSWKVAERRIARTLGSERAPLSGATGRPTRSDTDHPQLFIQVKHLTRAYILALFEQTAKDAKKEGKIPIVVIHKRGTQQRVATIDFDWLVQLWELWQSERMK